MNKKLHTEDKDNKAKKVNRKEKGQQKSADTNAHRSQKNLDVATLTHMQQTVGNQAVQAMLVQRKSGQGPTEVDESVADAIKSEKGKGGQLEDGISAKAGSVMGSDFSNVKVHTDAKADTISRDIGAKAFTTGNDIFFREGEYNPNSSEGQHLISHELTHVVQQGSGNSSKPSGVQGKMTVNDPNDKYEAEADKVADAVMSSKQEAGVQRAEEEEVQAKSDLQRSEEEEEVQMMEEEELQAKEIQRSEEEEELQMMEEEELQAKEIQRSEEEEELQMMEEEELQAKEIQRSEEEEELQMMEEEELQAKEIQRSEEEDEVQMMEEEEDVQMKEELQRTEEEEEA